MKRYLGHQDSREWKALSDVLKSLNWSQMEIFKLRYRFLMFMETQIWLSHDQIFHKPLREMNPVYGTRTKGSVEVLSSPIL